MKATGVTRPLDKLYRVVIPRELCKVYKLNPGDRMKFCTDGNKIILEKEITGCEFCGGMHELKPFGGKQICGHCREEISKLLAR